MTGKFEIKQASNGQYHFNLKAANGSIILSSEMYTAKKGAERGIESVKTNAPNEGRYERRTGKNGEPYFVLKAGNGEVIGASELYTSTASMEIGIESVKRNAPGASVEDLTEQSKQRSARA